MVMAAVLMGALLLGWYRRVSVFDCFVEGAKDGLSTTVKILPSLIGLLVAIGMLKASGALDFFLVLVSPISRLLRIPSEVMPLALMRPVSGSGSLAIVSDLLNRYGADSFIGRVASVMMGSTETTFYTIAVYFGSIGVRRTRHTVAASLVSDFCGMVLSVACVWVFFE